MLTIDRASTRYKLILFSCLFVCIVLFCLYTDSLAGLPPSDLPHLSFRIPKRKKSHDSGPDGNDNDNSSVVADNDKVSVANNDKSNVTVVDNDDASVDNDNASVMITEITNESETPMSCDIDPQGLHPSCDRPQTDVDKSAAPGEKGAVTSLDDPETIDLCDDVDPVIDLTEGCDDSDDQITTASLESSSVIEVQKIAPPGVKSGFQQEEPSADKLPGSDIVSVENLGQVDNVVSDINSEKQSSIHEKLENELILPATTTDSVVDNTKEITESGDKSDLNSTAEKVKNSENSTVNVPPEKQQNKTPSKVKIRKISLTQYQSKKPEVVEIIKKKQQSPLKQPVKTTPQKTPVKETLKENADTVEEIKSTIKHCVYDEAPRSPIPSQYSTTPNVDLCLSRSFGMYRKTMIFLSELAPKYSLFTGDYLTTAELDVIERPLYVSEVIHVGERVEDVTVTFTQDTTFSSTQPMVTEQQALLELCASVIHR